MFDNILKNRFIPVVFQVLTFIKIIFLFLLIFSFPFIVNAQLILSHSSDSTGDRYLMAPRLANTIQQSNITHNETGSREDRCLRTGQWIGAISGGFMGFAQIYWSATGVSGIHGPFWKNVVTGVPSIILGAYVGAKTMKWTTRRIMKGDPKPGRAALKGAFYGAVSGTIILTASLAPLLITGYYMDTIHFNMSDDLMILKLLGIAAMGGTVYGGTFGAAVGAVYGPSISLYMKF